MNMTNVWVYVPWTAMIVCEILLFLLIWKNPGKTRYRGFEAYIAFSLALSLVLMGLSLLNESTGYFWVYYLGAFLKTCALSLAVYEQYRSVFFPRWSLTDRTMQWILATLGSIVLISFGLVAFTPQATPLWELASARRIVSLSDYLLCGSMGLLLIYSEFLKIQRPERAQSIVRGLIAVSILGVTSSMMLAVSGTQQLANVVGYSTTIGFVAVLISWILAFRKPDLEVATGDATESPLDQLATRPVQAIEQTI